MIEHEHKFVHLTRERYWRNYGRYARKFVSIDYFYCEKCLEDKTIKKEEVVNNSQPIPDWAIGITHQLPDEY